MGMAKKKKTVRVTIDMPTEDYEYLCLAAEKLGKTPENLMLEFVRDSLKELGFKQPID